MVNASYLPISGRPITRKPCLKPVVFFVWGDLGFAGEFGENGSQKTWFFDGEFHGGMLVKAGKLMVAF
jgi:hypothetical protein